MVSSRRDADKLALGVTEQLKAALAAQGITATSDSESVERLKKLGGVEPRACDGARLCLQKLAQLLQGVVVGVDVSRAGRLTAGHVEAVAFDRVESLAVDDITSDAKQWSAKSNEAAKAFAEKLKAPVRALSDARRVKSPPKAAENELKTTPALDAPREATVVPEPPPTPPPAIEAVTVSKKASGTGPLPFITTGAAVVAAGAGILCLVLGFSDRSTYFQSISGGMASSLTDAQLQNLAYQSNLRIGLGGGLLGLAGALGITSALLFMKE